MCPAVEALCKSVLEDYIVSCNNRKMSRSSQPDERACTRM